MHRHVFLLAVTASGVVAASGPAVAAGDPAPLLDVYTIPADRAAALARQFPGSTVFPSIGGHGDGSTPTIPKWLQGAVGEILVPHAAIGRFITALSRGNVPNQMGKPLRGGYGVRGWAPWMLASPHPGAIPIDPAPRARKRRR